MNIDDILQKLFEAKDLNTDEVKFVFNEIMQGEVDDIIISAFLSALTVKGETADEITGAVSGVIANAKPFPRPNYKFGDIVGTGGDKFNTINVSSVSAIVSAGVGAKVCKHGNRKVSSLSGSADLLSSLGLNIDATPEQSRSLLDDYGVCFLMAPNYHPSIKNVMPVRQTLKKRTVFNILGPLLNPARPDYIVNGVYDESLLLNVATAHKNMGIETALIVHGDGLDEIGLHGVNKVAQVSNGKIEQYELSASDFGVAEQSIDTIAGGDVPHNTQIAIDIINGTANENHQNIVAVNVATLLKAGGIEDDLKKGVDMAKQAMADGSAKAVLQGITK